MPITWLLLHYKLPPRPSARRVYVWRKLQRLGAVLWQDAVWVLPATARTREQFQWLAAEIAEMRGEATLWEARPALPASDEALVRQFTDLADTAYRGILKGLERKNADRALLSRHFQQAQAADYFQAPLGRQVRQALLSTRGGRNR